jgi:hypothetical protein
MSNEIQVRASLQIRSTTSKLVYQSQPTAFNADLQTVNPKGPVPGALTIPVSGMDIDLSKLTKMGGQCRIMNVDPTNYFNYGMRDPSSNTYYPLGEVLPGEFYPLRLARNLGQHEVGTGTFVGTTAVLHVKGQGGSCQALVEAFDP